MATEIVYKGLDSSILKKVKTTEITSQNPFIHWRLPFWLELFRNR